MVSQTRKVLGRGLAALLPENEEDFEKNIILNNGSSNNKINYININKIRPYAMQPRSFFSEKELQELAASIQAVGVLQPIIVRESGNYYEIIAGERRYKACKLLGLEAVPCLVKNCNEQEALQSALIENIQRQDLNPIEEAKAYKILNEEHKLSHDDISKTVGKERSTISNYLRILKLPFEVQNLINQRKLSLGHAKVLCSFETNEENLIKIAEKAAKEALSIKDLEKFISKASNKKEKVKKENAFKDMEDILYNSIKSKVKIQGKAEKGKIIIDYYSYNELERIYSLITRG